MPISATAVAAGILVVSGISAAAHTAGPVDGGGSVAAFELSELGFLSDEPWALMKDFAMSGGDCNSHEAHRGRRRGGAPHLAVGSASVYKRQDCEDY
ncbi:MAG: hypothetical protein CL483_04980 [Acidobacteria bacterium]|nr:hypothetical protein [Acidobacteriota bacterium]